MESLSQEIDASFIVQETTAYVGGGAMPQHDLSSFAIAVRAKALSADTMALRLRMGTPAVVGRIQDGALLLDMRTVGDSDLADLTSAIRRAL